MFASFSLGLLLLFPALPSASPALQGGLPPGERVFEAPAGVTEASACQFVHDTISCQRVHIDNAPTQIGATFRLGGTDFVLDWMGPGYRLSSGRLLHAMGSVASRLVGQEWLEVDPGRGIPQRSLRWDDVDSDGTLSRGDVLILDRLGPQTVEDVRLNLRARPAGPPD
jgi:hypothetical protein